MSVSTTSTANEVSATPTENVVYLIGELRGISRQTETKTGSLMVRRVISIARHWTDNEGRFHEDYDEFELSSWGQVAEKIIEIKNGALVRVKGRVKVEKWTDGAETKSAVRIAAENVTILCY
jgi:single-stranded DNA-binding protein